MKNRILYGIAALSVVTLLTTSCAKVPQADIDSANVAVNEAKVAQADIYVPDAYNALQDSLKSTMSAIEAKKGKWFTNYNNEKAALANVITLSGQVKEQTAARINELKVQINNTLAEVNTLMAENKDLITKAPKGKEGAAALEAIKADMATIDASVTEATDMLNKGDLLPTLDKVQAAKEKATGINSELKEAIAKKAKNTKAAKK